MYSNAGRIVSRIQIQLYELLYLLYVRYSFRAPIKMVDNIKRVLSIPGVLHVHASAYSNMDGMFRFIIYPTIYQLLYVIVMGAVLLDLNDPSHVLARSDKPILEPNAEYEKNGFFGDVVFSCGVVVDADVVKMYYGVADTSMACAELSLREIMKSQAMPLLGVVFCVFNYLLRTDTVVRIPTWVVSHIRDNCKDAQPSPNPQKQFQFFLSDSCNPKEVITNSTNCSRLHSAVSRRKSQQYVLLKN
jgi:hypothetical protein